MIDREDFIIKKTVSFHEFRKLGVDILVAEEKQDAPPFNKIIKFNWNGVDCSEDQIKNALYKLGLDIKSDHYEITDPVQHRTEDGSLHVDFRFVCRERSDKEWLSSGKASQERQNKSSKMRDLDQELARIGRVTNWLGR